MIDFRLGDATDPEVEGIKIVAHIVNDTPGGKWGKGFVVAINAVSPTPKAMYHKWARGEIDGAPFELGNVQLVKVRDDLYYANCVGQHRIYPDPKTGEPPVRYDAIRTALQKVAQVALKKGATVCMPRIGAGYAGGEWWKVQEIIDETLISAGVPTVVYDLDEKQRATFDRPPHSAPARQERAEERRRGRVL